MSDSKKRVNLKTSARDLGENGEDFLSRAFEAMREDPRVLVIELEDGDDMPEECVRVLRKAQAEGALNGVLVVFRTEHGETDELLRSHGMNGVYGEVH